MTPHIAVFVDIDETGPCDGCDATLALRVKCTRCSKKFCGECHDEIDDRDNP